MKQSSLGLSNTVKRTRKREFLDAMELVVPWAELVALIQPHAPEGGRRGQQPFAVQTLLRIHFMQQWFKLSDPAMEEALHDVPAAQLLDRQASLRLTQEPDDLFFGKALLHVQSP
ncbi:transposase-like protein DUF772 [Acidovorax temperans]|jgi:IS5 family transposase|uniref:Transposase-like protein DUF772 n=1 Tax=Acidovorax temperans TaxID=80878 RepID=A0A543LIY9_9BURK|nr:transposase-like protein DUF772 [Acidovorax temperans]